MEGRRWRKEEGEGGKEDGRKEGRREMEGTDMWPRTTALEERYGAQTLGSANRKLTLRFEFQWLISIIRVNLLVQVN